MNEIARILRKLAEDIELGDMIATQTLQIRDVNGNRCGAATNELGWFSLRINTTNDAFHVPGEEPAYC